MNCKIICLFLIIALLAFGCGKKKEDPNMKKVEKPNIETPKANLIKDFENLEIVNTQFLKYEGIEIKYDASKLTDKEKKALFLLANAAKSMNTLFTMQVYSKNMEMKKELKQMFRQNPKLKTLLDFFTLNFGPFDRLENNKPFINLSEKKPLGANFYPPDMTKQEFENHIKANPADEKNFTSPFHVIVRKDGKLKAVPYSDHYKSELEKSAAKLREAAELLDNKSLKKYLNSRADAFLSNDYYQSDIDWMDLKDHKIDVTIGPYEVYEDELFNYKAAFEAFISLVDEKESKKLGKLASYLDDMEKNLPIDAKYKKDFKRGKSSPILVVNEVYNSGNCRAGVQTTAYNLPNDERVREAKGSKKVMLKNVSEAKFHKSLLPISEKVLSKKDYGMVSFDAYFNYVLMHEISHGLGPGAFEKNGQKTTVAKELKELYSTIEEAKADILGLWNCLYMVKKGVYSKELEKNLFPSYLGGIFRSVRFGIDEAHGGGTAIQMNYIMEKQGFTYDKKTGQFGVNPKKIMGAVKDLATELLEIECTGDYARAKQLIDKYRNLSPETQEALTKLTKIPTDILPTFTIEIDLREQAKAAKNKAAKNNLKKETPVKNK